MDATHPSTTTAPSINVTPLIDVLLVLLIIFMVAAPFRPHRFTAKLPSPPDDRVLPPDIRTLVVSIDIDRSLKLNGLTDMGTVDDMSNLNQKLVSLFEERLKNHVYRDNMATRSDLPDKERIEKTVFIKAPRSLSYGEIARVIDGLKGSGAEPIGLQLDSLK
jgi:biopolymer transport protein ExbD